MDACARLASASLLLACCVACGFGGAAERMNTAPLERYTRTLPITGLTIERCGMFGASRSGYCLLRGTPASAAALTSALPLAPDPDPSTRREDCRSLPGLGRREVDGTRTIMPGGARHLPSGPLPPNTDNVHLRAVTLDAAGTNLCIDYEYPYG